MTISDNKKIDCTKEHVFLNKTTSVVRDLEFFSLAFFFFLGKGLSKQGVLKGTSHVRKVQ